MHIHTHMHMHICVHGNKSSMGIIILVQACKRQANAKRNKKMLPRNKQEEVAV